MALNDDGEFELVLGNRQLVSVFLIVVILLGVFFSMGYIVGRNSGPGSAADHRTVTASQPIVVENPAQQATATPPKELVVPPADQPVQREKPAPSRPAEQDAKPEPRREAALTEEKRPEPKPVEAKPVEQRPKPEAATAANGANAGEPGSGTYLQVAATSRADAEIVAETLSRKSFHASIAPVPGQPLFRVLVGPVHDAADLAETRVRLEQTGFKPIVRKY